MVQRVEWILSQYLFGTKYKTISGKAQAKNNVKYKISGRCNQNEITLFENEYKTLIEGGGKIGGPNQNTIMVLGANPSKNGVTSGFLNGTIYSVRIYNRALTDDEVMQNYKIDKMLYGVEDIN